MNLSLLPLVVRRRLLADHHVSNRHALDQLLRRVLGGGRLDEAQALLILRTNGDDPGRQTNRPTLNAERRSAVTPAARTPQAGRAAEGTARGWPVHRRR